MSIRKAFKTVSAPVGIPYPIPGAQNADGSIPTFWIKRAHNSNPEYVAAVTELLKPYRKEAAEGKLDPVVSENVMRKVFARACIGKWENVQEDNGETIPFDEIRAEALLTEMPDLLDELRAFSEKRENFLLSAQTATVKN